MKRRRACIRVGLEGLHGCAGSESLCVTGLSLTSYCNNREFDRAHPTQLDDMLDAFREQVTANNAEHARSSVKYLAYLLSESVMETNFDARDLLRVRMHPCFHSMYMHAQCV